MSTFKSAAAVLAGMLFLLSGCATTPSGPRVAALPGSNKSHGEFRYDDAQCRQQALNRVEGSGDNGVSSAIIGTAIGALAGGAFGGRDGAAVGAGTGLLIGSAVGADKAYASAYDKQREYDAVYTQCMYANGQRVPVAANSVPPAQPNRAAPAYPPPPPSAAPAPRVAPPPNYAPAYPPPPPKGR